MPEGDSQMLFQSSVDEGLKLDYFIAGICGAIFAYITQTYSPHKLGWNPSTLEPLSLALLALCVGVTLKRIETIHLLLSVNQRYLENSRRAGAMTKALAEITTPTAFNAESGEFINREDFAKIRENARGLAATDDKHLRELSLETAKYYRVRNRLLLAGSLAIFLSKILQPYS